MLSNMEVIRSVLAWCGVINFGILLLWFTVFTLAPGLVHGTNGKWLNISRERMGEIHYNGMLFFRLAISLFNIAPYLALSIVG